MKNLDKYIGIGLMVAFPLFWGTVFYLLPKERIKSEETPLSERAEFFYKDSRKNLIELIRKEGKNGRLSFENLGTQYTFYFNSKKNALSFINVEPRNFGGELTYDIEGCIDKETDSLKNKFSYPEDRHFYMNGDDGKKFIGTGKITELKGLMTKSPDLINNKFAQKFDECKEIDEYAQFRYYSRIEKIPKEYKDMKKWDVIRKNLSK